MLTLALLRIVKRAGDDKAVIASPKAAAMETEHSWDFYHPPLGTVFLFLFSLVHLYNT